VSLWEPFSARARRAVVRSQEVAQMFGAHFIGTEHMIFALAEGDDPVGEALAKSVDREALRERLGNVSQAPVVEMVFTPGAKRAIELAFENARRLNHDYIGTAHMALGILASPEPPPLMAGHDAAALRSELDRAAAHDQSTARKQAWKQIEGGDAHLVADAITAALRFRPELDKAGTRISVTVAVPGEPERTWSWLKEDA
jgi:ATP-dependent Clp protease ATP-binding subunit ClpA